MKRFLLLIPIFLAFALSHAGNVAIVSNETSGGTPEDSITVVFVNTDSIGNNQQSDSFLVAIFNGRGDSTYAATYIVSAGEIDFIKIGSRYIYRWTEQISEIDGAGMVGGYVGCIIAVDTLAGASSAHLDGHGYFSFQLNPSVGLFPVDEISDGIWDEVLTGGTHNIAKSAGKRLRQLDVYRAVAEGTAQDGAATWILLDSSEPNIADWFTDNRITILTGTGENQSRMIEYYANDTCYLSVGDDWITVPDNTSEYQIAPFGAVHVADIHTNVIDANALKADAVSKIATASADSTWDDTDSPTRKLTELDEDNTTIDLDGSTVGGITSLAGFPTIFADSGYAEFTAGSNEDEFKATGFSTHDSTVVWGAIIQVLNDSSSTYQGIVFDSVAVWGAVIQVLNDSSSTYQGAAGALDSTAVWGAIIQVLNDSSATYQGDAGAWTAAEADSILDIARHLNFVVPGDTTQSGDSTMTKEYYTCCPDEWDATEKDSVMAFIIRTDSLNALAGIHPGYKFDNNLATDIDTSYVISLDGTDTMWTVYYYHIGGPSGGTPDSTLPVSGAP